MDSSRISSKCITSGNELWGHPKGLFILFLTEMWERFSYYGMRSVLIYYMVKQLMFNHAFASHIYGLYTGLVYLSPCFGGIIADRVLGRRKAVAVGAVLMSFGQFMMAKESLFFYALFFLIIGNGFFKPNISTQVADLYAPTDHRLDRAFSIFYVGINVGAFFSPLVCGSLGELYGWSYGFEAAGVGMVIGLIIYLFGQRWLAPEIVLRQGKSKTEINENQSRLERDNLLALTAIGLVTIAFWSAYEQQGNTLALWADSYTDRRILGWELPATWFQALNPALIFLFTPLVTGLWAWQSRKNREPSAILKMAIGCFLLGIGFLIMVPAAWLHEIDGSAVGISWLVAFNLVATMGELYLAPIGLSLVTKMSPKRMVSMMMGIWFLSSFAGNFASGYLGHFWDEMAKTNFFLMIAVIALGAGVMMLSILKRLKQILDADRPVVDTMR
ncbi:MAG: peptide MFS transporter [Desulfomonilaceae bacterium]